MIKITNYTFITLAILFCIACTWKTCVVAFSPSSSSALLHSWASSKGYYDPPPRTPFLRTWQKASWKVYASQGYNGESGQSNDKANNSNSNSYGDRDDENEKQGQSSSGSNGNDNDNDNDDLSWISKAMNLSSISNDMETSSSSKSQSEDLNSSETKNMVNNPLISRLQSGLSGFAIDSQLGFVCILSPDCTPPQGDEDEEEDEDEEVEEENVSIRREKFTFVTVSPLDTESLSSPEALCLIQLAGGLDLGAAVFPPETLASLVRNELVLLCDEEDDDDDEEDGDEEEDGVVVDNQLQSTKSEQKINLQDVPDVQDLRSKVTLLGVTALPNEVYNAKKTNDKDGGQQPDIDNRTTNCTKQSTSYQKSPGMSNINDPKRKQGIQVNSPKILAAVQNLPGLTKITLEQVIQAMEIHADSNGQLNQREAFSELLDTLRTGKGGFGGGGASRKRWDEQRIKFKLTVSLANGGELALMDVDKVPPFQALALALRYKVPVTVSRECFQEIQLRKDEDDDRTMKEMFPSFKPMQELMQDARVMDGLISSMFFKESASDDDIKE